MTRSAPQSRRSELRSPDTRLRHGLLAASLAAAFALPSFAPALADDGPVFKKRRDKDITIIVIDRDDRDQKRFVREENRKPPAQRSIKRPDDDIVIKLPKGDRHHDGHDRRDRSRTTGTSDSVNEERFWGNDSASYDGKHHGQKHSGQKHGGPKVIIVDPDTSACKGDGVCVIRP